jgi:hypothetical protein
MKAILLAFLLMHTVAIAGPVSAVRYVDSQGVEVIHDRASAKPAATTRTPPRAGAIAAPALQVSVAEQTARDLDRIAILEQELAAESQQYAGAAQRLQAAGPTGAADTARLPSSSRRREGNIKALHAELRRTRRSPHPGDRQ